MKMVREFEDTAMDLGHNSLSKEAVKYSEEFALQLQLNHPNLSCRTANTGTIIEGMRVKVTFGG